MLWENGYISGTPMVHFMAPIIRFLGYNPVALDLNPLSGRIKGYSLRNGLTAKAFGELFGVDGSTVGAREKNITAPKSKNLQKVEEILN